jgi:hypothetical protein
VIVAYIAGPLTSGACNPDGSLDLYAYETNIRYAEGMALRLALLGFAPLCVHALARHMFGTMAEHRWIDIDLELLQRSDVVVLSQGLDGARRSSGTRRELRAALSSGKPVFESDEHLARNEPISASALVAALARFA